MAEEIRKLAELSSESAKEIDAIIRELQSKSINTIKTMASVKDSVKEQENAVVETELRFNGIAEAIETTMEIIERLNASGREMDNMKNQILSVLGNLAAIAEENAASTEEVSASTEELSASINMFSEASSSLASLAQNLQSEINKFKV